MVYLFGTAHCFFKAGFQASSHLCTDGLLELVFKGEKGGYNAQVVRRAPYPAPWTASMTVRIWRMSGSVSTFC